VAADRIAAIIQDAPSSSEYDGHGMCYLEFGNDEVARVDVMFVSGQPPNGTFEAPSEALAADKEEFGSSRIQRWFGREWSTVSAPH
jgi:sulfide:quinone oxidoreductase